MRLWLVVVAAAACDSGERQAALHNGRSAAVARELDRMRELEVQMCRCERLDCLARARSAIDGWWDGLDGHLGPPTFDAMELSHAEAIGRSADVCFQRTLTRSFLRAAENFRLEMCDRGGTLDLVIDQMRAYSDDLERLPGKPWPRFVGDERERAFASLTHFAWCAEAIAPGVQRRLPPVFRTWIEASRPERGPTEIRGG